MTAKKKSAYAQAGVDIDVMMDGLRRAKKKVQGTFTADVLSELGSFGGLFRSPGRESVLVSSIDGVGTKLKVAAMAGRHDTVGQDLVNHCVNDILVQGARPLFFMDYVGTAKLDPGVFADVLTGLCKACKQNGCVLLGGETAEMPGLYPDGEYDLVGSIVGVVDRKDLVTGKHIKAGDVLIGLKSTGLQTNGYSLARKILFDKVGLGINDAVPGTKTSVADALLAVHASFLKPVTAVMKHVTIQGMAHITGGGLVDNVPRMLPKGLRAVIDRNTWEVPQIFALMQKAGRIDRDEMYRVFNMGIGFVICVRRNKVSATLAILRKQRTRPVVIGHIEPGTKAVVLAN